MSDQVAVQGGAAPAAPAGGQGNGAAAAAGAVLGVPANAGAQATTTPAAPAAPQGAPAATQDPDAGGSKPADGAGAAPAAPAAAQLGQLEGDDGGDPAKATQGAPADAEVKLPDGVDNPALLATLKELKLDPTVVSKTAAAVLEHQKQQGELAALKKEADWKQTQKSWVEAMKADPDFGGVNYAGNIKAAERALAEANIPGLPEYLRDSGLRNFPPFIQLLSYFGNLRNESRIAGSSGGKVNGSGPTQEDVMRGFFDKSPEMFETR